MSNANDFIIENGVLTKYVGPGGDVVIPEGVCAIARAFEYRRDITRIVIPEGVTEIGNYSFHWCKDLIDIVIPFGVKDIGAWAFDGCEKLKTITLPDSVTGIGREAFHDCSSLESIVLSKELTEIGKNVFGECKKLAAVEIPKRVKRICADAFSGCVALANAMLPEGLEVIDNGAFYNCKELKRVLIPATVTKVSNWAFAETTRIEIENIGALISDLRLQAAICFAEDGGLSKDPRFPGHTKYIKSNATKLLEQAMKHSALLELMCREKLIAPKNVEVFFEAVQKTGKPELIAMMLDYQANKLTAKQKDRAVKTKERQEETVFDRMAARQGKVGIDGLNFVVSGELETFENRKELKAFLESKGAKLLSSLSAKTDYLIMNNDCFDTEKQKRAKELQVEIITEETFNEKAGRKFVIDENGTLTAYVGRDVDVVIPEDVKKIEYFAFSYDDKLRSVVMPETVEIADLGAFYGCSNLMRISATAHTRFYGSPGVFCEKVTIHAPAGSYAETYAKENNIPFAAE